MERKPGSGPSSFPRRNGSSAGNLASERLEANTGVVLRVAVNDIMQPKFQGSSEIGALPHAFLREADLLAQPRFGSLASRLVASPPLDSNSSPPPDFLSLSLSFPGDDTFPPGRLPGPHSSSPIVEGSLADIHLEKTGGDSRPPCPRRGQGDEMEISEGFQLRTGLGEGAVPGIKPTLSPVQRPGKK